jgi:hypothetical protein
MNQEKPFAIQIAIQKGRKQYKTQILFYLLFALPMLPRYEITAKLL